MKRAREWDEEFILGLPVGEFDWLEVKGRRGLDVSLPHVREGDVRDGLSRAVAAFANSGGGVLIYGLSDPSKSDHAWTVDDGGISTSTAKGDMREWLETVIPAVVDPILRTFNVYMILPQGQASRISVGRALYLVEIGDSPSAPHQASDHRYYARVGGRSCPIGHRIVADIMGRRQNPRFELECRIRVRAAGERDGANRLSGRKVRNETIATLHLTATNVGRVYAKYVNAFIIVPAEFLPRREVSGRKLLKRDGREFCEIYLDNTERDVVDVGGSGEYTYKKYGPSWFHPVLPGLSKSWTIRLVDDVARSETSGLAVGWTIYADNAEPAEGEIRSSDISVSEEA